jgi:hypothetical protein
MLQAMIQMTPEMTPGAVRIAPVKKRMRMRMKMRMMKMLIYMDWRMIAV